LRPAHAESARSSRAATTRSEDAERLISPP
jgi:hypothetical protein